MSVLSSKDIRRLLKSSPPLIEGWLNLDEQVQANGFDLTLRDVAEMKSAGTIAQSNNQRVLSDLAPS